jgi:hypothetical protein
MYIWNNENLLSILIFIYHSLHNNKLYKDYIHNNKLYSIQRS